MDDFESDLLVFVEDEAAESQPCDITDDDECLRSVRNARVTLGLVRHPPAWWTRDKPPALAITDPRPLELIHLRGLDTKWKLTGNPVAAVESIVVRHEAGYYPSTAVMTWLVEGLRDWLRHSGDKDLESCLGLKRGASQQASNQLKEAVRGNWTRAALEQLAVLHVVFDITVKEAAAMVHARLRENKELCTLDGFTFEPHNPSTLVQYWKRWRRSKILESDELFRQVWRQRFPTDARKWALLREFPFGSWENNPRLQHFVRWARSHVAHNDLVNSKRLRQRNR